MGSKTKVLMMGKFKEKHAFISLTSCQDWWLQHVHTVSSGEQLSCSYNFPAPSLQLCVTYK